jgi:hypothetical protein
MFAQPTAGPLLSIDSVSQRPEGAASRWVVTWQVRNEGLQALSLLAARLPHDQFYGEEKDLAATPPIPPGESRCLELPVACADLQGAVVKNVFLILRVLWGEEPWRVLARLRVTFGSNGVPENAVESVTAQPVGFSSQGRAMARSQGCRTKPPKREQP